VRGAGYQSALESAGPQAAAVERLWWFAFWVAAAVYALTVAALLWAAWRARRRERRGQTPPADAERRMTRGVSVAVGATVAILLVFLGYDLSVGRTITGAPTKRPLTIEVVGRQWWWEVTYADPSPQGRFTTANEIHVPVGRPVVLVLDSRDVIHSFWVPNLAGKRDLVPGRTASLWFQADTPGVYRGQCAEFCGHQHAKMALLVVAEPPDQYARWAQAQRAPAPPPTDPAAARGRDVFMRGTCVMCHAIAGTPAASRAGPDLTHVASRRTLAAGTVRNTRGSLAGWIVDPQGVKPGTHMPPNGLSPADLDALLTYLQSLR
jgi:cytochrome c oxidase subunit 2